MSGPRAVFLDRDGVINELVADPVSGRPESPLRLEDVSLIPGTAPALRRLAGAGWRLVGVSNQPSAAKGLISVDALYAIQSCIAQLLADEGVSFDDFQLCLHHPDGVIPSLTAECDCRKPAPGMLLVAARDLGLELAASWMVGDTDRDVVAGQRAGCRTALIEHPGSSHKRSSSILPDVLVADLAAAADLILAAKE